MQTQARRQRRAARRRVVAAWTPARVAVRHVARRAVVARRDHAPRVHQHAAHAPFHAVGARGRQAGQRHEVLVPGRPEAGVVGQVERGEGGVEGAEGGRGVEEAEVGAREDVRETERGGGSGAGGARGGVEVRV